MRLRNLEHVLGSLYILTITHTFVASGGAWAQFSRFVYDAKLGGKFRCSSHNA